MRINVTSIRQQNKEKRLKTPFRGKTFFFCTLMVTDAT